jgi:hypothetical protein
MVIATKDRGSMQRLKKTINSKFPIVDNGPIEFFLNMHFSRDWKNHTIAIHQTPRIQRLIKDARLSKEDMEYLAKSIKIPAKSDVILTRDMCPVESKDIETTMSKIPYKSILGIILYIAITARPDLTTAVSSVGRYAQNPGIEHWHAVLDIVRYLKGTSEYQLILDGRNEELKLNAYSDADWATDSNERKCY